MLNGKTRTWAAALAQKARHRGHRAFYIRLPKPIYHLTLAKADGSYQKNLKKHFKTYVLVLEDFGLAPFEELLFPQK